MSLNLRDGRVWLTVLLALVTIGIFRVWVGREAADLVAGLALWLGTALQTPRRDKSSEG